MVAVVGYGAMGKLIYEAIDGEKCVVAPECEYKTLNELPYKVDSIIDFSNHNNLDMVLNYAISHKIPVVIGTTGYSDEELNKIKETSKIVPIMHSSNYSVGINLLNKLLHEITPILKDNYDIEVLEAHHNKKKDAPSGTLLTLLKTLKEETGYEVALDRTTSKPRQKEEIGVSVVRGGTIAGTHEVMYLGDDEEIILTHRASSKKIFVSGALKAHTWLLGKLPGLYTMEDVLNDSLIEKVNSAVNS